MISRTAVASLALLAIISPRVYPAGSCTKTTTGIEEAIYCDATISRLDSDLSAAWQKALSAGGDTSGMKARQRDWLRQRDSCGPDFSCLKGRYQERLAEIGALDRKP